LLFGNDYTASVFATNYQNLHNSWGNTNTNQLELLFATSVHSHLIAGGFFEASRWMASTDPKKKKGIIDNPFYTIDDLPEIAENNSITTEDLIKWNHIDSKIGLPNLLIISEEAYQQIYSNYTAELYTKTVKNMGGAFLGGFIAGWMGTAFLPDFPIVTKSRLAISSLAGMGTAIMSGVATYSYHSVDRHIWFEEISKYYKNQKNE
jgi:hypothetical protein